MSRQLDRPTGVVGILILLCVILNFYAAYNVPNIPSGIFPQTETHEVNRGSSIPESSLWKYLLKEQTGCGAGQSSDSLSFRKQVQQYLDSDATSECSMPPPTVCQSSKVSVVVLSEGTNMRTLFLSLLSFLSYDRGFLDDSPIAEIFLVTTVTKNELGEDQKYGQRILDWGKEETVKIIHVTSSLWDALEVVNPLSESVIWFNGDVKKDWNLSGIQNSHSLWKENSDSMIASRLIQTEANCRLPDLHHLMVPREFLCFLNHPLMDSFRRKATGSSFDVFKGIIALFWSTVAHGNVLLTHEAYNVVNSTIDIPDQINSFFGCDCTKQVKVKPSQKPKGKCVSDAPRVR